MGTKNQDVALDVIGKKIRLKEEIDTPFDEEELKNTPLNILESEEEEVPKALYYKLNTKDAGFNCLCELNLGKAYKYTCIKDEEGNIVSEKRAKYPASYKQSMNEKWLDFMLEQIKQATNPVVVLSDIFTRVTTGNADDTLPYKEQLLYIYNKLNDPQIKDKIVALVRGNKEQDIINNNGPDLMLKLANMLDQKNKLVNSGFSLGLKVNSLVDKNKTISLLHFGKKINSVRSLALSMQAYANQHPGHDVYFSSNSKQNWYSSGVTTYTDENGISCQKPCWFVSFGGAYEYDKANERHPEIGPYTLNKDWYKVSFDENGFVRCDSVNYIYPHSTKIDTSSYTASVLSENMANGMKELLKNQNYKLENLMEKLQKDTRKQVVSAVDKQKQIQKQQDKNPNVKQVDSMENS